ncbi:unnamed protein product [Staurois parvus]|uniref:Uncharacterized protein n=1 Tax=Staurois parvus TaxID=386267 RepID=A0ABN9GGN2_9NEOB|nr:unnamed protein product [Staurois parvus]
MGTDCKHRWALLAAWGCTDHQDTDDLCPDDQYSR